MVCDRNVRGGAYVSIACTHFLSLLFVSLPFSVSISVYVCDSIVFRLSHNSIGADGAKALAASLLSNTTLQTLQ